MKEKGAKKKGWKKIFSKKGILILIVVLVVLGGAGGAGVIKASDNPKFCTTCHIMDDYYDSYAKKGLLANKHAEAGVTCHDCHTDSISKKVQEGVKFVTGDYETPLKKRNFGTREFCLSCHEHDDFDKIKEKTSFDDGTSNPHDSHNGEQDCNTCHSMHEKSKVECQECHFFDWVQDLDESWEKQ